MKEQGTLKKWNDKRGFGFIQSDSREQDVFIHISALKHMTRKPRIGDVILFDLVTDNDGKQRADYASIKGVAAKSGKPVEQYAAQGAEQGGGVRESVRSSNRPSFLLIVIGLLCVVYLYQTFSPNPLPIPVPDQVKQWLKPNDSSKPSSRPKYQCAGKQHCSQMLSCDEAKFYLRNCPNVKIDGDRDGIPCERKLCQ